MNARLADRGSPTTTCRRALLVAVLAAAAWAPVHAGTACEERSLLPEAVAEAFDAAVGLRAWLDTHKPAVAVIARRGQNLDQYGLRYSHAGFALRDPATGDWSFIHELNACGSDRSGLHQQGLADFFADSLHSTEVAVTVPQQEVQQELLKVLAPQKRFLMHHARYSAVAYPFATKYQNSNGWILETFANAVARGELSSREQAQAALRQLGYTPDVMKVRPLKRLGARVFKANVEFDDHPDELRWSNRITANTGDSTLRFVAKWGQAIEGCKKSALAATVCVLD